MRQLYRLGCVVLLAALVGPVSGQSIIGSAHDFSAEAWNTTSEVCITCHTPHNAMAQEPLWNHTVTSASFTVYSSTTLNATVGQPDGASLLCLSCHDGTIALDSFGGTTGSTTITGDGLIGVDLSNDHPISFTYDTALATADGELHDPATTNSGLGGTIAADMLHSGKMQCTSCHDVHNSMGIDKLLLMSNAGSALCIKCHDK